LNDGRSRIRLGQHVTGQPASADPALLDPDVEVGVDPVVYERGFDLVDEWGLQSFPASDPPANW
jgi:hypothetical protein